MNFQGLDTILWPLRVYEPDQPPLSTKHGKMDIRKVKADQLTLLACMPYTLCLVSNLEEETSEVCVGHFGTRYFIQ